MEGLHLHYTIESVKISNKIKAQKTYNLNLQKDIAREKIKLTEKMDLNTIKQRAEEDIKMEVSESINYVKIKSVSNWNKKVWNLTLISLGCIISK